jgi:hypothetical protein
MLNVVQAASTEAAAEDRKLTFGEIVNGDLTDAQVENLWYDWFCKDESLVRRGRTLIKRMCSIATSQRFPQTAHVFFKNNCPVHGRLYDSFSITDGPGGNVLFWVAPKLGYDTSNGEAQVSWGDHGNNEQFAGSWSDVKKFFKSTDAEWAAHKATMPQPKFTVGVKVAVLGGYHDECKEDEVAKVGDEGRFTLKGLGEHVGFKTNGEQIVHNYGRRRNSYRPHVRRCEVWSEYHTKLINEENARKDRADINRRLEAIKNKLYFFGHGSNEEVFARKALITGIEAILEIAPDKKD